MPLSDPDAAQIGELLDTVATKLPLTLYTELAEADIPTDMALKTATDSMLSFKDLFGYIETGSRPTPLAQPSPHEPETDRDDAGDGRGRPREDFGGLGTLVGRSDWLRWLWSGLGWPRFQTSTR